MSKGYTVHALMKQPRETVIDESLIRDCISLPQTVTTEEERMQIVGNKNDALFQEKTLAESRNMDLRDVATLLLSYRRIGRIDNLFGLSNLTKLCLDNNHIEKIENLQHLTKLQTLDLSYNAITVIEGLDRLTDLEHLSLYANRISAVGGLDALKKLTTLSLGKNAIEALDETATYLHKLKALRILTMKECRIASAAQYRSRILAFVPTLKFLDGKTVKAPEITQAREDQRENLLPVDEQDEQEATAEKAMEEKREAEKEYERYNCPNENTLYDELLRLRPDERSMVDLLRSDLVISATKETLDHNQNDFNDKAKELADAMKAIRARRDADEAAYQTAISRYSSENVSSSRDLIKAFEKRLKQVYKSGVEVKLNAHSTGSPEAIQELRSELLRLQSDLVEKEADMYDANESLNTATLSKWKTDGVDVVLQSSFETFFKLEGDFQVALRHALDSVHEMRQKKERSADDDFYFSSGRDETIVSLLDNKEEYQKLVSDWFEMRRKRLEEKEMLHLRAEERLLAERAASVTRKEQERHRSRLAEITKYVEQMTELLGSA